MTTNNLLKPLILIGLILIPFLGVYHEANAVVIPIILPMNTNSDHPQTCTTINSTTIHCVPDPPSPEEQTFEYVFMFIIIGVFSAFAIMIVRLY